MDAARVDQQRVALEFGQCLPGNAEFFARATASLLIGDQLDASDCRTEGVLVAAAASEVISFDLIGQQRDLLVAAILTERPCNRARYRDPHRATAAKAGTFRGLGFRHELEICRARQQPFDECFKKIQLPIESQFTAVCGCNSLLLVLRIDSHSAPGWQSFERGMRISRDAEVHNCTAVLDTIGRSVGSTAGRIDAAWGAGNNPAGISELCAGSHAIRCGVPGSAGHTPG